MSNIKKYKTFDLDEARAAQKRLDETAGSNRFMTLAEGKTIVRFLPAMAGMPGPLVEVMQHFVRLPGKEKPVVFACPRSMAREFCPLCARADQYRGSRHKKDQEMARELYSSLRVYANVIDRGDEAAGPKILGFGRTIYSDLIKLREDDDFGDFTHPKSGYDIQITRTGTGRFSTKYTVIPRMPGAPLKNMQWVELQPDLSSLVEVPSLEEIEKRLSGEEEDASFNPADFQDERPALPRGQRAQAAIEDEEIEDADWEESSEQWQEDGEESAEAEIEA